MEIGVQWEYHIAAGLPVWGITYFHLQYVHDFEVFLTDVYKHYTY